MKYIKQALIIFIICLFAEFIKYCLPFPIPTSIYGMALLFISLISGIIKLEHVKDTGLFLIEIMPLLFIPAGVGLIETWSVLQPMLLPITIIMIISTITVFGASSKACEFIINHQQRKDHQ